MPSDIRSFFGGKPPAGSSPTPEAKNPAPKKSRAARKVVDDSDEEDFAPPPRKSTPSKPVKRAPSPEGEATTSSEYFAKGKPKRSEPVRPIVERRAEIKTEDGDSKSPTKVNGKSVNGDHPKTPVKAKPRTSSTRTSARKKASVPKLEELDEDDFSDNLSLDEPVDMPKGSATTKKPAAPASRNGSAKATPSKATPASVRSRRIKKEDVDYNDEMDVDVDAAEDDDDFEEEVDVKPKKGTKMAATKRKAEVLDDEDDDEEPKPKKSRAAAGAKKKKDEVGDSAEITAIMANIPTIRAPTPPPRGEDGKFKYDFKSANNRDGPATSGTKDIPVGAENCLAGRSFVFTGQLATLGREEGSALVKRYGGKVMSTATKNTNFVVLGEGAGPKKLQTIKENAIKTIDEDGLYFMIRTFPANGGDSKAAAADAAKKARADDQIRKAALKEEAEAKATAEAAKMAAKKAGVKIKAEPEGRLWTAKHAPTSLSQVVGNKGQVEKLQRWLRNFEKSVKSNFKLPGPDGTGLFRAVIIHGPPGIGKTTAAHLVARLEGFDIVESNASDTRSKKLVETGLASVLDTTSLAGYFAGDFQKVEASKRKLCLIMDEVDGMSAGDRGGVGAMAAIIKKTHVPIILICNERRQPKMKPFDHVAADLKFIRPPATAITSRIKTIMHREKLSMPDNALQSLVEGTGADIRQIINMISTAKLDEESITYEGGKAMSKAWEKHVILKPWDIVGKILGPTMFNAANKSTLNDKTELYFNDHEMSYLMVQENYLKPAPSRVKPGKFHKLQTLQLVSRAADSISDGDMVDRMIHGSQQQWSLMPAHAIFSFVRPAYYIHGNLGYSDRSSFPSWLGQNSAQGKFTRMIKEIQGHMRLRMTGDRHDVRQQYLPLLWKELVARLQDEGKEAVDEIIKLMDSYYLTKDDFDAIMELGVGPHKQDNVKIESADKGAFTREYNKREHPLPFMKASGVAPKMLAKVKPDLEEAIEEDDAEEVLDIKDEDDEEDMDISKDKYVKQPKKKKAPAAKSKAGAKKRKVEDEDDLDEEEDTKPKKAAKGKAAAKPRGKK